MIRAGDQLMSRYQLKLNTESEALIVELRDHRELLPVVDYDFSVYSDLIYDFELIGLDDRAIRNIDVFINGEFAGCVFSRGVIVFPSAASNNVPRRVFDDFFGLVTITLVITEENGERLRLNTGCLPLLVKDDRRNAEISGMLDYIMEHQASFLYEGNRVNSNVDDRRGRTEENAASRLYLAEEICRYYEDNFGYFDANSKFEITESYTVDNIEKLQNVTAATLQYVVTHPEHLKESKKNSGITVNRKNFYPEKTLVPVSVYSKNIYENRVIVAFLEKMKSDLKPVSRKIDELLADVPGQAEHSTGYIDSASFLFSRTKNTLSESSVRLKRTIRKLTDLKNIYSHIMQIPAAALPNLEQPPKPTATFRSIPQYNLLFKSIYRWFGYGEYDLSEENFLLSFVNTSKIYEYYILCRLIQDIQRHGFHLDAQTRHVYKMKANSRYKNTDCFNIFSFSDGSDVKLELYFQPVVYNYKDREWGKLDLYRNNSYSLKREGSGGRYYTPDYMIKVQQTGTTSYHIIDAKYSTLSSVQQNDIAELFFKYLSSISVTDQNESVAGMSILYGKCREFDAAESAYDYAPDNSIRPYAMIIPCNESGAHKETSILDTLSTASPHLLRK